MRARTSACYGKKLLDPSWTRAEKAAFAIGFSGDAKKGMPLLLAAMKPMAAMSAGALPGAPGDPLLAVAPRHQGAARTCIDKLEKQIERDEKAVRIPGARDLLGETRVTLAIIQNNGSGGDVIAAAAAAPAAVEETDIPAPTKGKGKAGKASRQGQGRRQEAKEVARRAGGKRGRRTLARL